MEGMIFYNKIKKDGTKYGFGKMPNLLVDDAKEYILDFFSGKNTWHDHKDHSLYETGQVDLWTWERWAGIGICMFNNASEEARDGINGVPAGSGANYPIADTLLVSPEDSFLSNEVGSRVMVTATRRDQTVEFTAKFNVPGDIPSGTEIREFGLFLQSTGPLRDPSYHDASKPYTMLCRSAIYGTGMIGGTGCYSDDPLIATDTIQFRWKVGEL